MKDDKSILGKLLSIAGAILVVVGVFVFQGASHADDPVAPADTGGVGLIAGGDPAEPGEPADPEDPVEPEITTYALSVKYYKMVDGVESGLFEDNYDDIEPEHTFIVSSTIPEGDGEFYAWYDKEGDKYYTAADEITLNAEKPEIKLEAKFKKLRSFALSYEGNGGYSIPNSQSCESYLDTCDFTISSVVPIREGFEFKGWQKVDDNTIIYSPGSSIRSRSSDDVLLLKAIWAEIRTYTLIYEGNGGSGVPEPQVCRSSAGQCTFVVSDVMPTRASFEFIDWQKGSESVGPGAEITVVESTTILVANWNPVAIFTLEYVADDAQNIPEPQKCESSFGTCTFIVADKEPTRNGYRFKGWKFEGKEDAEEVLAKAGDELIVGIDGPLNLRMIAQWSKIYMVLNSGEIFGVGERMVLRSSADYAAFKNLTIDSEEVPADYYTVVEGGGTSVILSNAFSQALSAGEHAFTINWTDGEANGIISVNQNEDGTKRFVIVDGMGSTDGNTLMYRPKAGAVSRESTGTTVDSAKDNGESSFDAVRTLIIIAVGVFITVYIVNRFYIRRKMDFIEEF